MTPTTVKIPWTGKGWEWGRNPVHKWCDENCESNYTAACFSAGPGKTEVRIMFYSEKDATMFLMFYKNEP